MSLEPGLHDLSWPEYYALPYLNQSILKEHKRSAAHAQEAMLHPKEQTPALFLGQAIHTAVLEPEKFHEQYVVPPKVDRRTKAGKTIWLQFEEDNPDKLLMKPEDYDACQSIRSSIERHSLANRLVSTEGAKREATAVWDDPVTGLRCKARIDLITRWEGWTVVVDLKSTIDASPRGFPREVGRYDLAFQAAWYIDGINTIAPLERRFLWIAAEKKGPFAVAVFEPDIATIDSGRRDYRRCLKQHKQCLDSNSWPGYGDLAVHELTLPPWAMSEVTYDDEEWSGQPA